jgi:4-hydroxy-3-methylbut-2-enyl diphosphate reductase
MARRDFEIVLAQTAGFCMGVRRAVRMVLDAAEDPRCVLPIKTPGPLIHNRQVLELLARRGILLMDEDSQDHSGTAVVRAHGLSVEQQEQLRRRCEQLLDATCPHVRKVQEIVREYAGRGYLCVVVGDAGHAEVDGVLSYAGNAGHVIGGPEEVDSLPAADRAIVVAQTTQDEELFRRTVERVRTRYPECLAFETICQSTELRQAEVRKLARQVDAMVVVGGLNSANTRRLAEISAATGTPTFHVETEGQLEPDRILQYRKVGLTAGASTPNWMIKRVVWRLLEEHYRRAHPFAHAAGRFFRALINSGIYAAAGAAALTFANARLSPGASAGLPLCMAVSFLFVLAQHILNQYARRESLCLSEPEKADFFMANEGALLLLGICSSGLALVLACFLGRWAFGLVALTSLAGLVYRLRLPLALARRVRFRSLERLPGSREAFTGLAWAALAALVPPLAAGPAGAWHGGVLVGLWASFLLVVGRTLTLGLGAVESDQLVGRETLAGMLGPAGSGRLFVALAVLVAGGLAVGGGAAGLTTSFWLPLLAVVPYEVGCFVLMARRRRPGSAAGEAITDAVFYLAGALALAWGALHPQAALGR